MDVQLQIQSFAGERRLHGARRRLAFAIICALWIFATKSARDGSFESDTPFLRLHAESGDKLFGPAGIALSLAAQILSIPDIEFDLSFADRSYCDELQDRNTPYLCDFLQRLLLGLPTYYVVFCVIDGISIFERQKIRDDLVLVIQTLSRL